MHEYWHVILESLIHVVKILPFLFIVYYLIELIEFKQFGRVQNHKLLKGKASPVVGSVVGSVPQCGFSVISTDLFSKGKLSIGALIAVYVATSDEAIPLMIANPKSIGWMALLIGVKVVYGILVGYISMLLFNVIFTKKEKLKLKNDAHEKHVHKEDNNSNEEHNHENHDHEHEHDGEEDEQELIHGGCCHHHVKTKTFDWLHPMIHCLKIGLFIFVINILFGLITHIWVGEQALVSFLSKGKYWQPLLAVLIGLIPNCASSVVLTELFLLKGLTFGALVAGLSVNAGLGLVVLIKQNKNWKVNLFICLTLIISSLILGYSLIFI